MFAGVFGDGIAVRLGEDDLAEALRLPGITRFEPMAGRTMSGWALLTAPVVGRRAVAARWVDRAFAWARSAPPKPTRASRARPMARAK